MYEEIAKVWIEALRSGDYLQGKYALKTASNNPCFCCLGVLCDLYQKHHAEEDLLNEDKSYIVRNVGEMAKEYIDVCTFDNQCELLPSKVQSWAGLKSTDGTLQINGCNTNLVEKNDTGFSFTELADLIEENQQQL